jgi:hypothetical protein
MVTGSPKRALGEDALSRGLGLVGRAGGAGTADLTSGRELFELSLSLATSRIAPKPLPRRSFHGQLPLLTPGCRAPQLKAPTMAQQAALSSGLDRIVHELRSK